jgi:hypothetical protein
MTVLDMDLATLPPALANAKVMDGKALTAVFNL